MNENTAPRAIGKPRKGPRPWKRYTEVPEFEHFLFVPNDEDTISVNSFDPQARSFRTDRFPLSQSAMAKARAARAAYQAPRCGAEGAASALGEMQSGVTALLPAQPTERLVYTCSAKSGS